MSDERIGVARNCLTALLVIGLGLPVYGVVFEPLMTYFSLDAVLAPDVDAAKRKATMELLLRAAGGRWLIWTLAGLTVAAISGVGIRALQGATRPGVSHRPPAAADPSRPV